MLTPPSKSCGAAEPLAGKRVLVVGLGRFGGGVGVTRWLAKQGARVTVSDQADPRSLEASVAQIADLPVTLHLGGHDPRDLDHADLVILNPAVNKGRSEFFREIVARDLPWTTELNLFCERCPARVIGITGTFGKSTTCAMLAEALESLRTVGGVDYTSVHLGGNIGRSLLGELSSLRSTDLVVLEISSAQLEDLPRIRWAPNIAVITNLRPHHLDRYASYGDYVRAKLNIIGPPQRTQRTIVGRLDEDATRLLNQSVAEGRLRIRHAEEPVPPVELRVPGAHNQQNAACVLAVGEELGLNPLAVRAALRNFRGLEHRIEYVRTFEGVDYYNDSKSTSPVTTTAAIRAFDHPLVVIIGGQHKEASFEDFALVLARGARTVICMGEAGPAFARNVRAAAAGAPDGWVREVGDLAAAVRLARSEAKPGDAVLFSPGAPSFDAYANYAERGRHFVKLVHALR